MADMDLWSLYRLMYGSRLFELAIQQLWEEGRISGEMHMGLGEEAISAAVVSHLQDGDAMALDHRGTPPLYMRGVDPVLILRELLGHPEGLCGGLGGHMHLFSRDDLIASSGIVGASGPAAVGFAAAAERLRPGTLAVASFGEGAMNQGMLLESINLAVAWTLPVLFICKDNQWAITTPARDSTGGDLAERARGFGMPAVQVDGMDVEAVWTAVKEAVGRARGGGGPTFIQASCTHPEGHFLGYALFRLAREPLGREMRQIAAQQLKAVIKPGGAPLGERLRRARAITGLLAGARRESESEADPVALLRLRLVDESALAQLEDEVSADVEAALAAALA